MTHLEKSAEVRRQTESYIDYIIDDCIYPPQPNSINFIQSVWQYAEYNLCPDDASEKDMREVDDLITFHARRYMNSDEFQMEPPVTPEI